MPDFNPEAFLPSDRDWNAVTGGESGAMVFRSTDGLMHAKCVPTGLATDLVAERARATWLTEQGLPCAEPAGWFETEDGACLLTTTVPGVPATELPPSDFVTAWPSIVATMRRLHDLPTESCPFDRRLSGMFRRASETVAAGRVNEAWLRPERQGRPFAALLTELQIELPARLEQETVDLAVSHGDACQPNFIVDPETLSCTGLIDLGRLGTADRHADLALLWSSASDHVGPAMAPTIAGVLTDVYGAGLIDPGRMRFYLYLDPLTW